jgi:hypothetical protein
MHGNRTTQTNRLKEGNADGDAVDNRFLSGAPLSPSSWVYTAV